jgi:hypothetical protein
MLLLFQTDNLIPDSTNLLLLLQILRVCLTTLKQDLHVGFAQHATIFSLTLILQLLANELTVCDRHCLGHCCVLTDLQLVRWYYNPKFNGQTLNTHYVRFLFSVKAITS